MKSTAENYIFSACSILVLASSWAGLFFFKGLHPDRLLVKIWMVALVFSLLMVLIGRIKRERSNVWVLAVVVLAMAVMLSFSA